MNIIFRNTRNSQNKKIPIYSLPQIEVEWWRGKAVQLQQLIDKIPDRYGITKEAKQIRAEFAAHEGPSYLAKFDSDKARETISNSMFSELASDLPYDCPELILSFNLHLTKEIVRHLCKTCNDPTRLAFLCSRVVELGGYCFNDPRKPFSVVTNLSASKLLGYFFTPPEISMLMALKLLVNTPNDITILDPAAGSGSLLAASMIIAVAQKTQVRSITGIEIDSFTCDLLREIMHATSKLVSYSGNINIINDDALSLLCPENAERQKKLPISYDRIIMNPPYGRLRFLRSFLTNKETRTGTDNHSTDELALKWKNKIRSLSKTIRNISETVGSGGGIQDYPRIFLALGLLSMSDEGRLVVISPDSWLGDVNSFDIRRAILGRRCLQEVITFRENSGLFDTVNQATAISVFQNGANASEIALGRCEDGAPNSYEHVSYDHIQKSDPCLLRIPRTNSGNGMIYNILMSHPTIDSMPDIRNLRGEVDQSLHKDLMTAESSGLKLIRGDHIERFVVRPPEASSRTGYLKREKFAKLFQESPKFQDFENYRIVGRQCSYFRKKRRLSFALLEPGNAVGNSCNYLCLNSDQGSSAPSDALWALLGLLNSTVLEWCFRVYNSNNHVANYEIGGLPVCLNHENIPLLSKSTQFLNAEYRGSNYGGKVASALENFHDALVASYYGLTPEMIEYIFNTIQPERANQVKNILRLILEGILPRDMLQSSGWFQHYSDKLSELDRQIVNYVPQGGNWQNIPKEVPSKRLDQIREVSKRRGIARTTYYGRLKPDQPAYTISTYFNRPGNGTNIHPFENRTLTAREAARLQSFPDSYIFLGNKMAIRRQIGNAVPPLLSYALGKSLAAKIGPSGKCVDIFCGAGGISLGLELAGWQVLLAADNDKYCLQTYQFNRPCYSPSDTSLGRTMIFPGNLTESQTYDTLLEITRNQFKNKIDLLIGGPPCQGFSHAGWRKEHDARNDLATVFIRMAQGIHPKLVVLENVEGILTMKHGQIMRDIILTLEEIGYCVQQPWFLYAEQYGVPQMRRRVFLVAALTRDLLPELPPPLFRKCEGRREKVGQLSLLDEYPAPVTVSEALVGLNTLDGCGRPVTMGTIRTAYSEWSKGFMSLPTMLKEIGKR